MANRSYTAVLLAGASVIALSAGMSAGPAKAVPIEVFGTTAPPPSTINNATVDYIWIFDSTVNSDVLNNGTIAPGNCLAPCKNDDLNVGFGIRVNNESTVNGNVGNSPTGMINIIASETSNAVGAGNVSTDADADGWGIWTDDESTVNGSVFNDKNTTVTSTASGSATSTGTGNVSALFDADANSYGLLVENDSKVVGGEIRNTGPLVVEANAQGTATATTDGTSATGADATAGTPNSLLDTPTPTSAIAGGLVIRNESSATGDAFNAGDLDVKAIAQMTATATTNDTTGNTDASSSSFAQSSGFGLVVDDESTVGGSLWNKQGASTDVISTATANSTANAPTGADADATAEGAAIAGAEGIKVKDESSVGGDVKNEGGLNVSSGANSSVIANAADDSNATIPTVLFVVPIPTSATAEGLVVDNSSVDGAAFNAGDLDVTATSKMVSTATSTGTDGDAKALSVATSSGLGLIVNDSTVGGGLTNKQGATTDIISSATAESNATGSGTGDANTFAVATADAEGMSVKDDSEVGGDVKNDGVLNVSSTANAKAISAVGGTGLAKSSALATSTTDGIKVAGGDSSVVNGDVVQSGTMTVKATSTAEGSSDPANDPILGVLAVPTTAISTANGITISDGSTVEGNVLNSGTSLVASESTANAPTAIALSTSNGITVDVPNSKFDGTITESNSLAVNSTATATGKDLGEATSTSSGIQHIAQDKSNPSQSTVSINNTTASATSTSSAIDISNANAISQGSNQEVLGTNATASLETKSLAAKSNATASADPTTGTAIAIGTAQGSNLEAIATKGDASTSVHNIGNTVDVENIITAPVGNIAIALATPTIGDKQTSAAPGDASTDYDNDGESKVKSQATANGGALGLAVATSSGFEQTANGGNDATTKLTSVDPASSITITSDATATATTAAAIGIAASQGATLESNAGTGNAVSTIENGVSTGSSTSKATGPLALAISASGATEQSATSKDGDARAYMTQTGGLLDVSAASEASGAIAGAVSIAGGPTQSAEAKDGDSLTELNNESGVKVSANSKVVDDDNTTTLLGGGLSLASGITQTSVAGEHAKASYYGSSLDVQAGSEVNSDLISLSGAFANGLDQTVIGGDDATGNITLEDLHVKADAKAEGDLFALASAGAQGGTQFVLSPGEATGNVTNSGNTIDVSASSIANSSGIALALNPGSSGYNQVVLAGDDAYANFYNEGKGKVSDKAEANGGLLAGAGSSASGINQFAGALGDATAKLENNKEGASLEVTSEARATSDLIAIGGSEATGLNQGAVGLLGSADASIDSNALTVGSTTNADGSLFALGLSEATGINQFSASGEDATSYITNGGNSLDVSSTSVAKSQVLALSGADAGGGNQAAIALGDATSTIANTGSTKVTASATSTKQDSDPADPPLPNPLLAGADASATGYDQFAFSVRGEANAKIENDKEGSNLEVKSTSKADAIIAAGAFGTAQGLDQSAISLRDNATSSVSTNSLSVESTNTANADGLAIAGGSAAGITQFAGAWDVGTAEITNGGDSLKVANQSEANGAIAVAFGNAVGTEQAAIAEGAANVKYTNPGTSNVSNKSTANAGENGLAAIATGDAEGHDQFALSLDGDASATIDNTSGSATVHAENIATAPDGGALAAGDADGFNQEVIGENAKATIYNGDNSLKVSTTSKAESGFASIAFADTDGMEQGAVAFDGNAEAGVENGHLDTSATAEATADDFALAGATGIAIEQIVLAEGNATAWIDNIGNSINSHVTATAEAAVAIAFAANQGMLQVGLAGGVADVSFDNDSPSSVSSTATAEGQFFGSATALAGGLTQFALGGGNSITRFTNSSTYNVNADADASAPDGLALAIAAANGNSQIVLGDKGETHWTNTGDYKVNADAYAEGDTEVALALAVGSTLFSGPDTIVNANWLNDHAKMSVIVRADGEQVSEATAIGNLVIANVIDGKSLFLNLGGNDCCEGLFVEAYAVGPNGDAYAAGHDIIAGTFDGTVENNRAVIKAYAEVNGDKANVDADAYGIRVRGPLQQLPGQAVGDIVNNGGQIWAGRSFDGGATIHRGVAIDTVFAPNPFVHTFKGEEHWGNIFGDVNIGEDDMILVNNGVTSFDGIVNNISSGGIPGVGTMVVADGGTWFMRLNPVDGASQVNVETFTQAGDGSLWFEIAATPGSGSFPAGPTANFIGQINGDTVNFNGAAVLRPTAGIYQNSFTYLNVMTAADSGAGEWSSVTSHSPLLSPTAVYNNIDGLGGDWETVDIQVERVAFNKADLSGVGGYTKNKKAVATGIENSYSGLLSSNHSGSAYESLVGSLFTLDAGEYRHALNQLEGSQYPQMLYSVTNSLDLLKRAENARMKYDRGVAVQYFGPAVEPLKVGSDPKELSSAPPMATSGWGSIWVYGQGLWGEIDGDKEAPGFDHDRSAVHAGLDYMLSPGLTVGGIVGYYTADLDFHGGATGEYDGGQVGLYAKKDWETWYLNGIAAYGWYDGSLHRNVAFGPTPDPKECNCFASLVGPFTSNNHGAFDADAWMLSGEGGHKFTLSPTAWIAPYVAFTYQEGTLDRFNERALGSAAGSALTVSGDGESFVSDLGMRASKGFALNDRRQINAELRAAWLHEFGDVPYATTANFVGVSSSKFKVIGSEIGEDVFALDAGLSVNATASGNLVLGVGYNGRFGDGVTENGVMGFGIWKFGGY